VTARSLAIADDPVASEAAEDVLLSGGSALGAVTAGFFAAAGAHSGVLLSPVSLLAAGGGIGARAFDGRCRQPGVGTKRPRGFKESESIPQAARVAVPAALTAVIVALAYDEQARVGRVVRTAIRRARDSGAEGRAEVFERVRAVGAGAVSEGFFTRALLHVAGEAAGGLITASDLRSVTDVDVAASTHDEVGARWVVTPWAFAEGTETVAETLGTGHAIVAVDVRGLFAVLSYRRVMNGVSIDELELEAPPIAVPVLRGVTRVGPGQPLPAPAPIAIRIGPDGAPIEALAAPGAARPTGDALASAKLRLRWDATSRRVEVVKT
jgi:gamma-glutamyltranspeptidase/glutathione hydrolase